jgi:glycine betaine/proline transport system permease protein
MADDIVRWDAHDTPIPSKQSSFLSVLWNLLNALMKGSFQTWALAFLLCVTAVAAVCIGLWGSGMDFPAAGGRPIGNTIDSGVNWLTLNLNWLFDGIKEVVLHLLVWLEDGLIWLPWPAVIVAVSLLAWRVSSPSLALFAAGSLLTLGFMGRLPDNPDTLWVSAMQTLAIVLVSVLISLALGIPLGILGATNRWINHISRPLLDGAQTMPSFVYLVPALLFFGLGAVPAVMATVIYSMPPVIRLTSLGIRQVSPPTVEAARSFGATHMQLLIKVQIPMAIPTIMAGVNQTTMLALSMVVIASLVGAGGLGEVVLRALGRQEPGNAFIGGMAIIFVAIIIDRITQVLAKSREEALLRGQ